ncbi:SxtJ family membrane protein [Terasakiella sp. A23]|uniref:SxtJ family membrane protein n=1 Tax=Terasakiella sp. FCG-A23 TaxID=3080561 RepID=UPI002954ED2B|nr:SxtJ family membrane protein [Terasakiella sp. A23]MDV7340839.1 SxtJ family membrane protein [Terasakiella sp. A23]
MHEEHQSTHEIETSSDRSFGLTVGGILALIEAYRLWSNETLDTLGIVLLAIAAPLLLFGLIYPKILAPLNKAWIKLGFIMFKIVNPIIMFLIYVLTIVPIGLIMRLFGKDPMRMKLEPDAKSYWIERDPAGPSPESMKNQF